MERLIDNATIPWGQTAKRVDIDQKIDQVWKCIRDAFLNLLDDTAAPAKCIQPPKLDEIAGGTTDWLPSNTLTKFNKTLRTCCDEIVQRITSGTLESPANASQPTLLVRLDQYRCGGSGASCPYTVHEP